MPTYIFRNPSPESSPVKKFILQFPGDVRAAVGYAVRNKLADATWTVMDASKDIPQDRPVILCKERYGDAAPASTDKTKQPTEHDIVDPESAYNSEDADDKTSIEDADSKYEGVKSGNDDMQMY